MKFISEVTTADADELEYQLKVNNDLLQLPKVKRVKDEEVNKHSYSLQSVGTIFKSAFKQVDKNIKRMNLLNQFTRN